MIGMHSSHSFRKRIAANRAVRATRRCASVVVATATALTATALTATAFTATALSAQATAPVTGRAAQGTVRTDTLWSQSLGIRKAVRVYLPPSYAMNPQKKYPVLFYLHGLGGDERNWTEAGRLHLVMDSMVAAGQPEAIIAMPDGDDGWWTTANMFADLPACRADTARREPEASYCVPWLHYDDYVAHDLVAYVDRTYRTLKSRGGRGIAGLSMGGYGAITLALAYPDVFAAAASHSGVLSPMYLGPHPFAEPSVYAQDSIGLRRAAGSLWRTQRIAFGLDTLGWQARDPVRFARQAVARHGAPMPFLRFDCGVNDPYIDQNRALHATLTALGVSHEYAEWPGVHDWNYWRTHLPESLEFLLARVQYGPP